MKYFRLLFLLVDQRNDDYDNEKTATGTDYYGDHGSIVLRTNLSSRSIIAFKKFKKIIYPGRTSELETLTARSPTN